MQMFEMNRLLVYSSHSRFRGLLIIFLNNVWIWRNWTSLVTISQLKDGGKHGGVHGPQQKRHENKTGAVVPKSNAAYASRSALPAVATKT
jgi:hypothetical protein